MLESMIIAPVPTRAEVSDVDNARTDAVVLSAECATGDCPVKMATAAAMIAFTTKSKMPIFCSKRRPVLPIIAVTPTPSIIYHRLTLLYGIHLVLSESQIVHRVRSVSQRLLNPTRSTNIELRSAKLQRLCGPLIAQCDDRVGAVEKSVRMCVLEEFLEEWFVDSRRYQL
ncbi:UNVERIFIED_CONTAM: hypothetical protein HDU68_011526 [Siphonaria sp. JEL0065]|nr:hypothetical protein HDU68_011526 [Siphonaria sp. JEL0065]